MIGDRPIHIQVDGGIAAETAPLVVAAGANVLVAGSAAFHGGRAAYSANLAALRRSVADRRPRGLRPRRGRRRALASGRRRGKFSP